jgi:hypothetical protein
MGMSFLGCGTMTVWDLSSRYLAWLPRFEMKVKPFEVRMLIKAEEESRRAMFWLGYGELSDGDLGDCRGWFVDVFEIEFDGFAEVGKGFLLGGAEAGDVVVEALRDEVRVFEVKGVVESFH